MVENSEKLLKASEVAQLLNVHITTLWRWRQAHLVPEPIQLSVRTIRWRASTIERFLLERAGSDQGVIK